MKSLSIIIPTLNEEHDIGLLLESIALQKHDLDVQIIIVDGGSVDKTVEIITAMKTVLNDLTIITSAADVGRQRNLGASHAKYDYLLFLDADVILPPGCINKLALSTADRQNFIAAIIHITTPMSVANVITLCIIYFLFFLSRLARTPVVNGDFMFTTKKVHKKIGGFKEKAILGEDTDYGLRAYRAGAKYRFIFRTYINASDRRFRHENLKQKIKLVLMWSKAFIQVRKSGPIYKNVEYKFGHYHVGRDKPKAVVFDFDGTIADSFNQFVGIARELVDSSSTFSKDEVERLRNLPPKQVIKQLGVKKWQLPILAIKIKKEITNRMPSIDCFEGMPDLVIALHEQKTRVYIMSSNSADNIRSVLDRNNMIFAVDSIVGDVSLFGKKKALRRLMKRESITRASGVYIGDEVRDIEAATATGLRSIAVTWGFNSRQALIVARPTVMMDTVQKLREYLVQP